MKNKKTKKSLTNSLFLVIVGTTISSILAEVFTNFKILTAIFKFFIWLKNTIAKFFSASISIPLWIFILLLIPAIIFVIRIIGLLIGKKKSFPYFSSYTRDEVEGVVWKWNWEYKELSKKYDIEDLFPFCPKCDCQLKSTTLSGYKCPNCDFRIFPYPKSDVDVMMIIKQRIRRMLSQNQNKG